MRSTRAVLLSLFAVACGARSSLNDELPGVWGAGGKGSSAGGAFQCERPPCGDASGGSNFCAQPPCASEPSGGAFSCPNPPCLPDGSGGSGPDGVGGIVSLGGSPAGGSATGGSSTGGSGGASCEPDAFDADPGPGVDCEMYRTCEPGEFVLYHGGMDSDRECSPCPPNTFSASMNQNGCEYSGCDFSERVTVPGTPSTRSECEPDEDFDFVDLPENSEVFGLVAQGTRVYAGMMALDPYRNQSSIFTYEDGAHVDSLELELEDFGRPESLAMAPDGSFYLSGVEEFGAATWVRGYPANAGAPWRIDIDSLTEGWGVRGVVSGDLAGAYWSVVEDENGTSGRSLSLATFAHPGPPGLLSEWSAPIEQRASVAADASGGFWILSLFDGQGTLSRLDSVASALEPVSSLGSSVAQVVSTPSGTAYAVTKGSDPDVEMRVFEVDVDGVVQRSWPLPGLEHTSTPSAIAVLAGEVVYVAGGHWDVGYYSGTGMNTFVSRLNLTSGEVATRFFVGELDDYVEHIAVTSDGDVYVAGTSHVQPQVEFFRAYVRRVSF